MVVRNRLAGQLVGVLYDAMSGNALQQKSSFLENKLNQQITSPVLTLIDDPFVKSGYGSRLYDDDGLAAKRRVMIDKGILKDYYIDYYYSKKLETKPTTGDSSNLVFELGKESEAELVKKLQKGILVTNFIGGNSDVVTGDFSFGITGLYVEDGKIVKPVNEMNISGNMKDLMMQLVAVGNDPNPYSSWQCPSMYFKDVQFSGL
ncbi:MAG: metallopeptidase TldD-related protein [Calditrichia bacterium]